MQRSRVNTCDKTLRYQRHRERLLSRHVCVLQLFGASTDVLWWFRNRVGPENFAVQGYKRQKMYPDFVVQKNSEGRKFHHVLVVESKGAHLEGNPDTTYKRNVASFFSKAGRRVSWQQLGEDFKDHVFRFQILDEARPYGGDWSDTLKEILSTEE